MPTRSPPLPRHLIGLGASAGGLAALGDFLAALPPGQGCAVVLVQHLGTQQPSALASLLQARTALTVCEARNGAALRADHVYVIVPGTWLRVTASRLVVTKMDPSERLPHCPIDMLFVSMAQTWREHAAAVVLSGMGSDGQAGARSVLAAGGRVAAQSIQSAQFDSMPRSAIDLGLQVLVDRPELLPSRLLAAWGQPLPALPAAATAALAALPSRSEDDLLRGALRSLAASSGHDFSLYKASTIKRRVARRMAVHGMSDLGHYVDLLTGSRQEADLLFNELLIGVTSFMRDPAVWEALATQVLPALMQRVRGREDTVLRVWVVGCSTGEEAFSLAMLMLEALDALPGWRLQIFGTDLSADAIQRARRGLFSEASLTVLSPARRARFFMADGESFRVTPALRNTVLFARHDVTSDPPFSRLDLVSCRNLLIYFTSPLQHRVLPLFHYVLRPGGVLVLGNSETVGRFESGFTPLDEKLRLFQRGNFSLKDPIDVFPTRPSQGLQVFGLPEWSTSMDPLASPTARGVSLDPTLTPAPAQELAVPHSDPTPTPASPLQNTAERLMLEALAPPAVLANLEGDILYLAGRTGRFLEPAAGKANWNVHAMAQPALREPLAEGLRRIAIDGQTVEVRVQFEPNIVIDLSLRSVRPAGQGAMVLIVFREVAASAPKPRRLRPGDREAELYTAHEALQTLREQMNASGEELQSANEELQSTNEELQSANEELTTSKEEMQAMNEELQSVNSELLAKLDDLALAQSDLKNLLNSTQIATLFLDAGMNVRRFTEQAQKVINVRDSDIGRPLSDLTMALDYPDLAEDIATVLRTLAFSEREIQTTDGRWYSVRILPYRTLANVIDGAVLTFVDVSAAKDLESRLRHPGG